MQFIPGLIVPIIPFALRQIVHLREDKIQEWTGILLGGYGAGVLIGSLVVGCLADHGTSRKALYLLGLVAVAASTIIFSVGRSATVLLFGRILQGASTASVHSVGTTILADTVGEGKIGVLMGIVDMSMALGSVLGPVAGGSLYHHAGYAAVFESAYILIAIDLVLRLLMREKERMPEVRPEDRQGEGNMSDASCDGRWSSQRNCDESESHEGDSAWFAGTGYGSMGEINPPGSAITSSLNNDSDSRLSSPSSQSLLTKVQISTHRHSMLNLLVTPRMLAALLADFAQSFILTALESTLPIHLKFVFNYDTQEIGLLFLMLCVPSIIAPAIGFVCNKTGARIIVGAGFLDLAISTSLLKVIDDVENQHKENMFSVLLLLIGLGLNMVLTPVFADVKYMVEQKAAAQDESEDGEERRAFGQAFALLGVAHASGSLLGPVAGGFVVERAGWRSLTMASGLLCAVCAGPTFWCLGGRVKG